LIPGGQIRAAEKECEPIRIVPEGDRVPGRASVIFGFPVRIGGAGYSIACERDKMAAAAANSALRFVNTIASPSLGGLICRPVIEIVSGQDLAPFVERFARTHHCLMLGSQPAHERLPVIRR